MSQVNLRTTATIIGAVTSLQGDIGGVVNPVAGIINVLGGTNITTSGAGNTLTIDIANQLEFTVQTTDDTPTTIFAYPISASQAIELHCQWIAAVDDYSAMAGGTTDITAIRAAAGAPSIGTLQNNVLDNMPGNPDVQFAVVGNTIECQVIGVAATTINWKTILTFVAL